MTTSLRVTPELISPQFTAKAVRTEAAVEVVA
jgi:hypothetical protein